MVASTPIYVDHLQKINQLQITLAWARIPVSYVWFLRMFLMFSMRAHAVGAFIVLATSMRTRSAGKHFCRFKVVSLRDGTPSGRRPIRRVHP